MDFVGIIKTAHARFPKKQIETIMKDWPGGSFLVMELVGSSQRNENTPPLFALGYKYGCTKVICFISTKNAGSTVLEKPFIVRYSNEFENVEHREVDRPKVASSYFHACNAIDVHNQARQGILSLEQHWKTHDCWTRLHDTLLGCHVIDALKCVKHGVQFLSETSETAKRWTELSVEEFCGKLAGEILTKKWVGAQKRGVNIPLVAVNIPLVAPINTNQVPEDVYTSCSSTVTPLSEASLNSVFFSSSSHVKVVDVPFGAPQVPENFRELHVKKMYECGDSGSNRRIRKNCTLCKKQGYSNGKTSHFCAACRLPFCYQESCHPTEDRMCFYRHICKCYLDTALQQGPPLHPGNYEQIKLFLAEKNSLVNGMVAAKMKEQLRRIVH